MDNFLSNTQIGKILSNLLNLIKENYKFVLYSTAGFLFISLIYSFSLSPKYQIIADVKLKDESGNASLPSSSSVLSLITGGGAGNNFWDFYNIVFSTEVAEKLWEKGYDQKIFSSNFDTKSETFKRNPKLWDVIKSWIIGYDLNNEINFVDLRNHIKSEVDLEDLTEEQNLLRFTISTGNPDLYETLLTDLIRVTDDSIKQRERSKNTNKIVFLSDKIASVSDVEIKNAMIGLLKEQLLNESLVEQDNYYSIEVLEQPRRSKNPDFINLQFIYLGFTFIGFMLSVLVLYIRKRILVS
ncbi:Wzz/FepE/Etk N-terminal domain-containing protein [SAR86 cluster bacterium]|uniref:Wzz/FepE/Etk N-terminal domain-containing protein n=1 Tax=SAR86 cluster bacterium TaxID=2030880 RepID=A0A9Q8TXV5_9GAMM|nr:Wzz/FepE/Etk N-terminal domain-containing protein [Pseudomonadota bacterium]URQ62955.1 Wzz/FepE/Etk N-terminal domain-containing protein [SAR86 cluster bacterium]URQ64025.1 Wzz/FepE/Etk N-terminal domain-containing protein [SAR86 cluster bacterium]